MSLVIATFGGEARSGKGTCVRALRAELAGGGHEVTAIDQGLKFRTLAEVALHQRVPLDDEAEVKAFLQTDKTNTEMMALLGRIKDMSQKDIDDLLYNSVVSAASAQIGRVRESHGIAIGLLRSEVEKAAQDGSDTVLIDGRVMEKYAREFADQGLGRFGLGWYFRCDSSVAARRSTGMFVDHANMTLEQKLHLSNETTKISERNRSDAMRETDPMVEPMGAFLLDFRHPDLTDPKAVAAIALKNRGNVISVTTSYTRAIDEMTTPVTNLSVSAIESN